MFESEIKFICPECNKIILVNCNEIHETQVHCGKCESICNVPEKIGPGVVIDDFLIEEFTGTGGSGDVWKAHQFSMDRKVALKILKKRNFKDDRIRDFFREAKAVAKLNHPNIVKAYKAGVDRGVLFFAMDFLKGDNLQDLLKKRKKIKQEQVVSIAIDITKALGYAWDNSQLVHRDIKPDNIIVSKDGSAKLMDLGLSKLGSDTVDKGDIIEGTPQYISPEQITGDSMDIRGDFYSLGATMYHLLSGRFPFTGTKDEIIDKHLDEKPQPLKYFAPGVNPELIKLIEKLLSKKPENRYQTAQELEKELQKLADIFSKSHSVSVKPSTKGIKDIAKKDSIISGKMIVIVSSAGVLLIAVTFIILISLKKDSVAKDSVKKIEEIELDNSSLKAIQEDERNAEKSEHLIVASPQFRQIDPGLSFKYFQDPELSGVWQFNILKPLRTGIIAAPLLDGIQKTEVSFGVRFDGIIKIPFSGTYTFYLGADKIGVFELNSSNMITASRQSGVLTKTLILQKGIHAFRLDFIQKDRNSKLLFEVESPRFKKQSVPENWFYRIRKN